MANFSKISVANDARTELHDKLNLTGAEISVNNLPAGDPRKFCVIDIPRQYEKRLLGQEWKQTFKT